jgi:hypothetical protein
MQWRNKAASYHSLIAAVILRAVNDVSGGDGFYCSPYQKDKAMYFLLSDDCENYCLELGVDCGRVRKRAAALYHQAINPAGSQSCQGFNLDPFLTRSGANSVIK